MHHSILSTNQTGRVALDVPGGIGVGSNGSRQDGPGSLKTTAAGTVRGRRCGFRPGWFWLVLLMLGLTAAPAGAHTASDSIGGFLRGFQHPLTGLDHMVAMVAVGLWGAFLGARAIWTLPVVFPVVMALGGAAGVMGVPMPAVETGIALSGLILGLAVAFAARPPLWAAGIVVGIFGVFHGHAHGTELPGSANALAYSIGFVISTGLLHLSGIAIGLLVRWPWGKIAVRAGGGVIAGTGLAFLFGWL